MDSSQIVMIFTFIVLISLSALFSMSETAFMSINKIRVKTLAEENNRKAILIRSLLEDQTRLLSYCNHNGDVIESAQNLFIHPNTLRQRLKKIEAILQMDLNNYTNIVNLMLALKIEKTMNI